MNITLFKHLNINDPLIAWETAIGRVKSSCDNNDNFGISFWQYGLFKKYSTQENINKIVNEFKLEKIRQQFFPNAVSRLRGLYFFESEEMARLGLTRWNNKTSNYLSAVNVSANNLTIVDSEWITTNLWQKTEDPEWMMNYWSGKTYGEKPLREILVSGIGIVQNLELRQEAVKKISILHPKSMPLLAAASYAFAYKNMKRIALLIPGILSKENDLIFSYFINKEDFDFREKEILDLMIEGIKKGNITITMPITMPTDPEEPLFVFPNVENRFFKISNEEIISLFKLINS